MDYKDLLKDVMAQIPKKAGTQERFVIPQVKVEPAGLRTKIINFFEIATALRRDSKHLLKFLLKELATKGEIVEGRLIVIGKFPASSIDKKVELYVKNYVVCKECNKPDTKIVSEKGFDFLVCEACGARQSLGKL